MDEQPCFLKIGCLSEHGCKPLHMPFNYDSFSPFVIAKIGGKNGPTITVGNESYPSRRNTAVIKSMEFGYMDKPQLRMEIVDETGGEMDLLVRALESCSRKTNSVVMTTVELKFGWVKSDCSKMDEEGMITFDEWIVLKIINLDVSFSGGLTKYMIEAHPMDVVTTNQREDIIMQSGTRLVDAIKQICLSKDIIPIFAQVEADGSITSSFDDVPWVWEHFGEEGPRAAWQGDNNDVLTTISRWISPYRIQHEDSGAGILMVFSSKRYNHLVLWKDPRINGTFTACESGGSWAIPSGVDAGRVKRKSLGTFVVNGGKCSPVIKFEPKFNLISTMADKSTGGGTGSAENSAGTFAENVESNENKRCIEGVDGGENSTGNEMSASIEGHARVNYPPNEVTKESFKSSIAHMKANAMTEFRIADIQGELTVIGMPTELFVDQSMFLFSPLSIIMMNPFHMGGEDNGGCGDWLVKSPCNEILSSRHYICTGVNHSIREGSYTTTLRVANNVKNVANV